jgi:hypothetical protein
MPNDASVITQRESRPAPFGDTDMTRIATRKRGESADGNLEGRTRPWWRRRTAPTMSGKVMLECKPLPPMQKGVGRYGFLSDRREKQSRR